MGQCPPHDRGGMQEPRLQRKKYPYRQPEVIIMNLDERMQQLTQGKASPTKQETANKEPPNQGPLTPQRQQQNTSNPKNRRRGRGSPKYQREATEGKKTPQEKKRRPAMPKLTTKNGEQPEGTEQSSAKNHALRPEPNRSNATLKMTAPRITIDNPDEHDNEPRQPEEKSPHSPHGEHGYIIK